MTRTPPSTRAAAFIAGTLLGCGGAGGRSGAPDRITLRFHPPAGAAYPYELEQQITIKGESGPVAGMGEQKITMRIFLTQAVTGPTEGGVGVTVTFDSTSMESPSGPAGMMDAQLRRLRGMTGQFVYDDRMRVVRADFDPPPGMNAPMTQQIGNAARGMSFPLPAGPVGRGDTWSDRIELPVSEIPGTSGPIAATTTITLQEIQVADADTTVRLSIDTKLPEDPIPLIFQGQRITMRVSGSMAGEQVFSVGRGAVVRGTMRGTMRFRLSGGVLGSQEMAMSMDQQVTIRLGGGL
ncbi:MAG: hypothetical protein ACREL9_05210 [Gemmatimonadales bacterium]